MAEKQVYVIDPFKYQHRMLTVGEPVRMDGPTARLYEHLGKVSERKPRVAREAVPAMTTQEPAPRKRTTRRKK